MKLTYSLMMALLMSMIGTTALAWDKIDGVYYVFSSSGATVKPCVGYDSYAGDIVIPESVTHNGNNYYVTGIGEKAFRSSSITGVSIPNTITSIGAEAFYNCSGLTEITIPSSVTRIDSDAFSGCDNLSKVIVPDISSWCKIEFKGNLSNPLCYAHHLYSDENTEVTNLTIPVDVSSIGDYAFYGCGLTSLTIPSSVSFIGGSAFGWCFGLLSVVLDAREVDNSCFSGTYIRTLTIGTNVQEMRFAGGKIGKAIWLTNTPPISYFRYAGEVNYVANDLYDKLKNKTVYPFLSSMFEVDGVKYVPVSPSERTCDVFDCLYDERAANVRISDVVSYKGIQMNVKKIDKYSCYGNPYIDDVQISLTGDVEDYSFYDCNNLKTAQINNNGVIGNYAFGGCSAMKTAILGDGISSIGEHAFDGCSELDGIIIPNATTTIGEYAFADCAKIGSAVIGNSVSYLGSSTFKNCASLSKMVIPSALNTIYNSVYEGCTGLKDFIIADRNTILNLGSNGSAPLFKDCPLDSVYIGGNISYSTSQNLGYSPFYRNTSLRTVVITDKETEISTNEFYGCTNLQSVKIGDGVESFGDWAFSGCSSLKNFSFGSSVKTIGKEAFSDCYAMERIYSRSPQPPVCGSQALDDINKWNCVLSVPKGHVAAYQAADQWKEFFFIEEGNDEEHSAIPELTDEQKRPVGIYSPNGTSLLDMQKGLNIVVMPDGSVRKILVKEK